MKAIDVEGFAGSFAAGVTQAGFDIIGKREPSKFAGFGVSSFSYNLPRAGADAQIAAPEDWALPLEAVDLVYGCPPCSGFSGLSFVNTAVHGTKYGAEADINECMGWFLDYAARVRPPIIIMESVALAFANGREFMEGLWRRLKERSGVEYNLTHVVMNVALVGGDVIRPRYFFVASTEPFGVGLEFVTPRNLIDVIGDLGPADLSSAPGEDLDWGHVVHDTAWNNRIFQMLDYLNDRGHPWRQGTRFPENLTDEEKLDPPEFMWKKEGSRRSGRQDPRIDQTIHSAWFSTDPFATVRWRADKPFGVVVAASLGRAVHPTRDRNFTWRELARFMSLPDDWSLRKLIEERRDAELGKAVPAASGKWIAHWAKMALEGTPGEYAGRATEDPQVRIIDVRDVRRVRAIVESPSDTDAFWDGVLPTADPTPATWIIDRKARPATWWQYDTDRAASAPISRTGQRRDTTPKPGPTPAKSTVTKPPRVVGSTSITRVSPEEVLAFLEGHGITKAQAAERLGVSASRINELTGHHRPKSWLNRDRWEEVQRAISG